MVVAICRVVLALPWNDSLKGKRSVVKSILERARQRFHVAAAEVDDLDVHRRATLGFAVVSNDVRHAQSVLDKLVSFIAGATQAELVDQSRTIEHYDLESGGLSGGSTWDARSGLDEDDEYGDDEEE
jgi:uncharacterized protein YlxP (DUF503 family)